MTDAQIYSSLADSFGLSVGIFMLVFFISIIWSSVWKAIALWKAGKNQHLAWFIVLFLVNTLGILEIIYIFAVKGQKNQQQTPPQQPPIQTPPQQ